MAVPQGSHGVITHTRISMNPNILWLTVTNTRTLPKGLTLIIARSATSIRDSEERAEYPGKTVRPVIPLYQLSRV